MYQEEDYASDSDQSDEDFCPDEESAAPASEEDESSGNEEDIEAQESLEQKRKGRNKTLKKKISKRTKNHAVDEEESDEEVSEKNSNKRCTRQTEADVDNANKSKLEKNELESDDDEKSRTDALWADFLSDVKHVPKKSSNTSETESTKKVRSTEVETETTTTNGNQHTSLNSQVEKSQAASRPKNLVETETPKQIVVTEIVDFAGEEVRVQKSINADSIKENKASITPKATTANGSSNKRRFPVMLKRPYALAASSSGSSSGGGLGSLLNQFGKKKKISVLEKSQLDWTSFKQDEGIDEELQTFNKGKDGYLERQDFLQRTDLRQFEIEKQLRQTKRNQ